MLLQLAALDEGLGTGVYGVPGEAVPELKELLGMPEDVHFVCVVTIGRQPPDTDDSPLVSRLTQARQAARRARSLGALGRRSVSSARRYPRARL